MAFAASMAERLTRVFEGAGELEVPFGGEEVPLFVFDVAFAPPVFGCAPSALADAKVIVALLTGALAGAEGKETR